MFNKKFTQAYCTRKILGSVIEFVLTLNVKTRERKARVKTTRAYKKSDSKVKTRELRIRAKAICFSL